MWMLADSLPSHRWIAVPILPVVATALVAFGAPASHAQPFAGQRVLTSNANAAQSVVAADLDGDGAIDVLSASAGDDKIAWYKNEGEKSFSDQRVITQDAEGAHSVWAEDIDGDGDQDVLSASFDGDTVAWYENNGGTFSGRRVLTTNATSATSVFAADLTGDGDKDVLSASLGDDKIAWYENTSAGSFSDQRVISTGIESATSVYAAPLNEDERRDVLSAASESGEVVWFENTGNGTFAGSTTITTDAETVQSVHAVDLDGDGDQDVLSASFGDDTVAWYENDGTGSFSDQKAITTDAAAAHDIHAADLDGDGDQDVLSASFEDDTVAWYENDGTGSFSNQKVITTSAEEALSVFAADLTSNGALDVLSASRGDNTIAWYENQGNSGPPAVPTGLSASAGDGQVTLSWDANTESDLNGYNIYRSTNSFSDISNAAKLNTALLSDPDYIDTDVTNGTEYFYRVTAVDSDTNESGYSNEVAVAPLGGGGSATDFAWPVSNHVVSQNYAAEGEVVEGEYHTGIDMVSSSGDLTIQAAAGGTVRTVPLGADNENHGLGNVVIVDHGNRLFTLYAHLASITVEDGAEVDADTQLGVMGETGNTDAVHLHFELKLWSVLGNLDSDLGPEWGYTPTHPNLWGYLNPYPYLEYSNIEHMASMAVQASENQIVRTGPDESYTTEVTSVENEQHFASFAERNGWHQIYLASDHGPTTGWVQATSVTGGLIKIDDPERGKIGVNVRANPAASSNEVSHVWDTQEFVYDDVSSAGSGCAASWYRLPLADNAPGNFGWVCGEYVSGEDLPEAPAAPTGLTASEDEGQVTLTWEPNNEDDLAEYRLYRNTSPEPTTQIATITEGNTTYDDPDVSNGTTYYYRLTSVDADDNESDFSEGVQVTPEGNNDLLQTPHFLESMVLIQESLIGGDVPDDFVWDDLQQEYENGIKHLAYLNAGVKVFDFGVYIDVDDYVGITAEGSGEGVETGEWVTAWIEGSVKFEYSLPSFGLTKIRYDDGNPDPLRGLRAIQPGAGVLGASVNVRALAREEDGTYLGLEGEWEPGSEFEAFFSLSGLTTNLFRFEIKRSALNTILNSLATFSGGSVSTLDQESLREKFIDFVAAEDLESTGEALYPIRSLATGTATREFTFTDDGSPPETGAYIESSGGGIDANEDGVPDNFCPVNPTRNLLGWQFLLNVRATGNKETSYVVESESPEGWNVQRCKYLPTGCLIINTATTDPLPRGALATTEWRVSVAAGTESTQADVNFKLYEEGRRDEVLDKVTVTFEQYDGKVLAFNGRSPVELNIETPTGETVDSGNYDGKQTMYNQFDVDDSGDEDVQVLIASPEDGPYNAQVIPKDDAQPSDTYTLEAINEGEVTTLAEDVLIEDTPNDPYRYILGRPTTLTWNVNQSFGNAEESRDYRLVALPGNGSVPVATTLDGENDEDWRVFYDNGQSGEQDDYLVDHDGSDRFNFAPGRGFWMLSENAWQSSGEVETVSLGENDAYAIDLHEGWNIISNPFGVSVGWNQVNATHSDSLRALWRFDGSFARADTFRSAQAGEAFYFLNDTGLDSLRIPYPGAPAVKVKAKAKEERSLLVLSAQPEGRDALTSTVKIGFDEAAADGLGPLDQPAPPGQFSALSLRVKTPGEAPPRQRLLATEHRPPETGSGSGQTFRLQLHAKLQGPLQITADNLEAVEGSEVKLLRPSTGRSYDLNKEETITLEKADSTALRLAVGSAAYVQDQVEKVVPNEVTLTSYPNPMRKQATLEYTLPETKEVQLTVYDVLGRRVATLEQGRKEAGRHETLLDGTGLSSGVYFGRLKVGDQTRTHKITVVR